MKKVTFILMILLVGLCISGSASSQDQEVYLTSYIPAPYGEYGNLKADNLIIEPQSKFKIIDEDSSIRPFPPEEGLVYYEKGTNDTEGFYYYDINKSGWSEWGRPGGASPWNNDGSGNIYFGEDPLEGNVGIGSDSCQYKLDISKGLFIRGDLYTDRWSTVADRGSNTLIGIGVVGAQGLTTGEKETAIGSDALYSITTGNENTAFGYNSLYSNTTGERNTASGFEALYSNTTSSENTAVGYRALRNNTQGTGNTAFGYYSLYSLSNAASGYNTAIGLNALYSLQNGSYNTAVGYSTINNGTAVNDNTAIGGYALESCTGNSNVAVGIKSMQYIKSGSWNTAFGTYAGYGNSATVVGGNSNTLFGYSAGYNLTSGDYNILIGYQAGDSITTGSGNIIIGYNQDLPTPSTSDYLNIGSIIYADLSTGKVSMGTTPLTGAGDTKLRINGGFVADSKDFDIAHPDPSKSKDGWRLRHSAVESPTRGDNLYRFQASIEFDGGENKIKLPSYWKDLNENPQVWVYAKGQFAQAYGYVTDDFENLIVKAQKKGDYNVLLLGTRKDSHAKEAFDEFQAEYIPAKGEQDEN
ncbi:MAG: hypothetical protein ABH843_05710 [Candidatus Omnitrophota bacterium]